MLIFWEQRMNCWLEVVYDANVTISILRSDFLAIFISHKERFNSSLFFLSFYHKMTGNGRKMSISFHLSIITKEEKAKKCDIQY